MTGFRSPRHPLETGLWCLSVGLALVAQWALLPAGVVDAQPPLPAGQVAWLSAYMALLGVMMLFKRAGGAHSLIVVGLLLVPLSMLAVAVSRAGPAARLSGLLLGDVVLCCLCWLYANRVRRAPGQLERRVSPPSPRDEMPREPARGPGSAASRSAMDAAMDLRYKVLQEAFSEHRQARLWARALRAAKGDDYRALDWYQEARRALRRAVFSMPLPDAPVDFPGSGNPVRPELLGDVPALKHRLMHAGHLSRHQVLQLCAQIDIDASLTQWADQPQGRTLLHWCALFDLGKEVDLLLSRGADATVCDGSGRQPWELAEGALADRLLAAVRQAGLPAKTADAPADCAKHRNDSAR